MGAGRSISGGGPRDGGGGWGLGGTGGGGRGSGKCGGIGGMLMEDLKWADAIAGGCCADASAGCAIVPSCRICSRRIPARTPRIEGAIRAGNAMMSNLCSKSALAFTAFPMCVYGAFRKRIFCEQYRGTRSLVPLNVPTPAMHGIGVL